MLLMIIFFAIIGLCTGSFINALVWRLHNSKDWVRDRSECTSCGHKLNAFDLVPIISWLSLGGKCRYCREKISIQYPLVEAMGAVWFGASYYYWPSAITSFSDRVLFTGWLISSVALLALAIYDHKYMILPSKIIYSGLFVAIMARVIYIFSHGSTKSQIINWALSVFVSSGIFFVIHEISKGQWIGFGDVRLGLLTGTLIAAPDKSALMIFIASLLGTLFALPRTFKKSKALSSRFAYGPFLIGGTLIVALFGQKLIDWYIGTI